MTVAVTTTLLSQSAVVAVGGVVSCVVLFVLLIVCVCGDSDKGTEDAVADARTSFPGTFQTNVPDTTDTNNITINVDFSVENESVSRSIMASADVCDPCLEKNKTVHAEKYCSECEQKLCAECTESHRLLKAFKSHHIIDLSSIGARILPKFEEIQNFNTETIGSVSQITQPCPIKSKSMKVQHPQVQLDRRKALTKFIKEDEIMLMPFQQYDLRCMAVTSDNKLLLCNHESSYPKVFIYRDYKFYAGEILFSSKPWSIAVVPCTDKAVVTLPKEESIQFINTTNYRKDKKIKIGEGCRGITAVKDKIYIDGHSKVLILNTDGSRVREITTDAGYKFNILYNERNDQLLLREYDRLRCINLDGHVIYSYDISGALGLAVDQQDNVYISGRNSNDIQRLSPDGTFRDIVLSKHDGVDDPWGITFNNDFTKLFVINRTLDVLIYSCR